MPPKYFSKNKRNYSNQPINQKGKNTHRTSVTCLLVGNNKIGIDIPYKIFNSDHDLKNIVKSHHAVWDKDDKLWVVSHKEYQNMIDLLIQHCKKKEYFYSKIPSFVYDAQLDMPLDLMIKITKSSETPMIRYLDTEVHIDPQTLPFYDKLYDFQKESLKFGIQHHGRLLLADEMGVGKTIQSLAIAFMYRFQWPMVIICPSTLRYNWQNQVLFWYGDYIKKNQVHVYTKGGTTLKDTTKVLIVSYQLAWKFKQIWSDFKIAIVDEAHYLKNSGCKRTDILMPQLSKKRRIILLTGTPAFARPREIYNLASIIRPDAFHNFIEFGNRYCQPSRNPWSGALQYNGCANSKQLFYLLKDKIMLRRLKKDVLTQLPDKQRQKVIIETNKAITKEIGNLMAGSDMKAPQDLIMEMFGLKNSGPERNQDYQRKRESLMEAYRLSGAAKLDGVVQYILSLLENDVKLLIFAHHRAILDRIQSELNSKKYKSIRIDGQVEMAQRQQRVVQFQNNKQIMAALLSISAAGVGLTLTASSTVVFAQLHWTPGMLIQAQDRAHRIGQKNCVNCHYLIGQGTLDNLLYNYLLKKINNVSTFVDGTEQILDIQQLSKGQKGKYSKTLASSTKKLQKSPEVQRKSFIINPIRRHLQLEVQPQQPQNSQTTDIESELPLKNIEQDTVSLKSRKMCDFVCHEELAEEIQNSKRRNLSRVKILTKGVQERNCSQSSGSLRTSDILKLVDQADRIRSSKKIEPASWSKNQSIMQRILLRESKVSSHKDSIKRQQQNDTDIDATPDK